MDLLESGYLVRPASEKKLVLSVATANSLPVAVAQAVDYEREPRMMTLGLAINDNVTGLEGCVEPGSE